MRRRDLSPFGPLRIESDAAGHSARGDDASRFRPDVSGLRRGLVRTGAARLDGRLRASGRADPSAGPLSGGRGRASGLGGADGGALGSAGGPEHHGGPPLGPGFDRPVPPGGYAWWYVDALSDDRQYGITIIAFIGSVFSPWYAWAGRKDPLNHCSVNACIYGPRTNRWAMTERKREALERDACHLVIGPSALSWDDGVLTIRINELSAPFFKPVSGVVRVEPIAFNSHVFHLSKGGEHTWRPIAPSAHVTVAFSQPGMRWSGDGYFDMNAGDEPLENGFSDWTWSRAALSTGSTVLYDANPRMGDPLSMALRFDRHGGFEQAPPPPPAPLPRTGWRVARTTRSDDGVATVTRGFEDTPFYARTLLDQTLFGERVASVHESLSLNRFANPIVRCMLPFRIPRW